MTCSRHGRGARPEPARAPTGLISGPDISDASIGVRQEVGVVLG